MTSLDVRPIRPDLPFGARVGGVTREGLGDEHLRHQINELFVERGLLVFEDVEPSSAMQVELSKVFGPLKDHPSAAVPRVEGGLLGVIEMRHDPDAAARVQIAEQLFAQWLPWHFDHCYNDQLNRAGVLRAVEIPDQGGRTGFLDGIALYEALSPGLRDEIEGANVLYAMDVIMANLRYGRPADFAEVAPNPTAVDVMKEYEGRPRAIHPAVWQRDTGEKVLHVSPWMAKGIEGREGPQGEALLAAVCDEIVALADELSYFHDWKLSEMLIWDNWRVLHAVSGMPPGQARCMHRTTIEGDYGLGRFETSAEAVTA